MERVEVICIIFQRETTFTERNLVPRVELPSLRREVNICMSVTSLQDVSSCLKNVLNLVQKTGLNDNLYKILRPVFVARSCEERLTKVLACLLHLSPCIRDGDIVNASVHPYTNSSCYLLFSRPRWLSWMRCPT